MQKKTTRTLFVAIDENERLIGCKNRELVERFLATLPEPQFIILVETTTTQIGSKTAGGVTIRIVNSPLVCTTSVSTIIMKHIGDKFRRQVPNNKLGIPILTSKNGESIDPKFGQMCA